MSDNVKTRYEEIEEMLEELHNHDYDEDAVNTLSDHVHIILVEMLDAIKDISSIQMILKSGC